MNLRGNYGGTLEGWEDEKEEDNYILKGNKYNCIYSTKKSLNHWKKIAFMGKVTRILPLRLSCNQEDGDW